MRSLILVNIISNNTVTRLNKFINENKRNLGRTTVLFCASTEANRRWTLKEKIKFDYKILPNFQIRFSGKDLFTYFVNPTIIKVLNKRQPDRLIITGWDLFAYQLAFFWGYINKRQITLWSGSTAHEPNWRRSLSLPLVKLLVKLSTDYIAYGTRAKDYLIQLGASSCKIKIFINDVNKEYFRRQTKKLRPDRRRLKRQLGINSKKNFLFVGQFIERKGVLDLLEAYRRFSKTHSDWGLVIVGYGYLKDQIERYIQKNKLKSVTMLGQIDQYDLAPIYVSCDILVLPSTEEVWGLVANEAIHCGLKVIVSDACGCAPDLVTPRTGLIFRSGSPNSLLKALVRISRPI